jgi:hypothetical protein
MMKLGFFNKMYYMFVLDVVGPDQQLVRHGSVCVYQCRSIYLIGTLELKIFFFFFNFLLLYSR